MTSLGSHRDVQVWHVNLASADNNGAAILSTDELLRLGRISHAKARHSFLRTRSALRRILSHYLGCPPEEIAFSYNDNGKPALKDAASDLQFNVSHSGDTCLIAVCQHRAVGLDVESVVSGRDHAALARRFYTPAEQAMLADGDDPATLFVRMWTLKEAAVKARGLKLLQGLDRFECHWVDDRVLALDDHQADGDERWTSLQWEVEAGMQAAVVTEGEGLELEMRQEKEEKIKDAGSNKILVEP